MDNRMLALWSTPRSMSGGFESMMARRGDFRCLVEPFGVAYYRGADRRTTRFDENPQDMSITYASTWSTLQREHRKGPLFIRDHPNYIMHLVDTEFLDAFQHTFLIHHPGLALPAMYEKWATFTTDECSYQAIHRLFDVVAERTGDAPVVIDSDDLSTDPYRTIEAYCKGVEITFLAEAIGGDAAPPPGEELPSVEDIPFLREMYDRCMPHYEALLKHRV